MSIILRVSIAAVRYGRVPKRSKNLEVAAAAAATPPHVSAEQENQQLAMYDVILTVSQAHHCYCQTTDDKAKQIITTPLSLVQAT